MEFKTTMLFPAVMVTLLVVQIMAEPSLRDESEGSVDVDKRPKYMDTRELQDAFKSLILTAIQELVVDGEISPDILMNSGESAEPKTEKRGRQGLCWRRSNGKVRPFFCWRRNEMDKRGQQGLCYRKLSNNRIVPYICWKNN